MGIEIYFEPIIGFAAGFEIAFKGDPDPDYGYLMFELGIIRMSICYA